MKSLLIVDDEVKVIRGLLDHIDWAKFGIHVQDTAANGEEAWSKIEANPPDMMITDIYMPKMDGLELIERVRLTYPSIYMIIHSGYDDFENARRAMRLGVQHFFYKPSTVKEIESVLLDIVQEIEVQQKQQKLLEQYNEQMKEYLTYTKDAFLRELLTTRYSPSDIPREKLELLQLSADAELVVASLSILRPPYLTKSKEREWQLMKFGAANILQEIIERRNPSRESSMHVVEYSDSIFALVFMANQSSMHLQQVSRAVAEEAVQHILLYMRVSLTAGIGGVKTGVHGMMDSFLESQRALEAAEYEEINKVYTFDEVYGQERQPALSYPLELLKDLQHAVERRDPDQLEALWIAFEQEVFVQQRMPLPMTQNVCVSVIGAVMMELQHFDPQEDQTAMAGLVQDIYAIVSTGELRCWMMKKFEEWIARTRKEVSGKTSNKLIQAVKDRVANNYDKEITLADIAESLYVNRNYLSQLFKRVTGETFVTYLNKYRIELAKEKLREGHYMVYEVSEMVGYQNPTYFSQVFKSITGVSPSEYYK